MDNERVRIFMAGVFAFALVVTIGALLRRLGSGGEAQDAPGSGWLQTTIRRWRDALQLAVGCPWICGLPFAIAAIEVLASLLWAHYLFPDRRNAASDLASLADLLRGFRGFRVEQAAHLALKAGSIYVGVVWTGGVVLVAGIWALVKRRASALVWFVWAVLTVGMVSPTWFTLVRFASDRRADGHWAPSVVWLVAQMGTAVVVYGLILLALRRATRQQPVSDLSIVDELARFWPEWFLLAFLVALPRSVFMLATTLATPGPSPKDTQLWLMEVAQNEWVRGGTMWTSRVLALALRFAPYALAEKACSAGEAARDSLRIWRERAPGVLRLLAPLWCLGIVVYVVLLMQPSGRSLSSSSLVGLIAAALFWLGKSLSVAFFVFAEIVCLQWYQSVAVSTPHEQTAEEETAAELRPGALT